MSAKAIQRLIAAASHPPPASGAIGVAGVVSTAVVGLMFLLAAFLKAWNPASLETSIAIHTALRREIVVQAMAVSLIGVEAILGATLVARVWPRRALAAAAALLLLFVAVLGWAWSRGLMDDCGCFGQWTRSPGEALVEDLIFLALVAFSWWAQPRAVPPTLPRLFSVGAVAAACLALTAWAGLAWPAYYVNHVGDAPFRHLYVTDVPFDLARGRYVVGVFSTACPHCQQDAPLYNKLAEDHRLPPVAMLSFQTRRTRDSFHEYFHLRFPVGHMSSHAISTLVRTRYPKFFLIRDGVIQHTWEDGAAPTPEQVIEAMRTSR